MDAPWKWALAALLTVLTLSVGCSRPPRLAVGIGWDGTESAREMEDAHATQLLRMVNPRHFNGPMAIAHVCNRPEGHLLYSATRPSFAAVKQAFTQARTACPCDSGEACGSDVSTTLRILIDALVRADADRRVLVMHSDLTPDPCRAHRNAPLDDVTAVAVPDGVEVHVYGVPYARVRQLADWAKRNRACLHPAEEIDGAHLGIEASGLL